LLRLDVLPQQVHRLEGPVEVDEMVHVHQVVAETVQPRLVSLAWR
jgi:hypothetical protein